MPGPRSSRGGAGSVPRPGGAPGSARTPPLRPSLCRIFGVGPEALEPRVNSLPHPPLPPRAALRGQEGGWGVISAICSTNQEFRKGNHTKCICYLKICFFISFYPTESQSTFFSQGALIILFFFFIFIKIPLFFFIGNKLPFTVRETRELYYQKQKGFRPVSGSWTGRDGKGYLSPATARRRPRGAAGGGAGGT